MFKKADSNITSAQKRQKETYDRKHQPEEIAEGTQVLLENTAQKRRKGGKLEPAWLGPYVIHRCIGKGLYELSRDGKVIKKKLEPFPHKRVSVPRRTPPFFPYVHIELYSILTP